MGRGKKVQGVESGTLAAVPGFIVSRTCLYWSVCFGAVGGGVNACGAALV